MCDGVVQHEIGHPPAVLLGVTQQGGVSRCTFEIQVRPVLPGESDTAVHLDRVGGDPLQGLRN